MNIDRPLDDFVKDSLRAKRAEKKKLAAARRAKKVPTAPAPATANAAKKVKVDNGRASSKNGPINRRLRRPQGAITKKRRRGGRREGGPSTQNGPSRPILTPGPLLDSPSFERVFSPPRAEPSQTPSYDRDISPKGRGVTVAVSNLHPGVTQVDITELFETVGPLKRAVLRKKGPNVRGGDAEVVFENMEDALDAIRRYNNVPLDNQPLHITLVTGRVGSGRRGSASYR